MNMSYRRAWLLIQDIEATIGGPVVVAKIGGAGGGGVALTKLGRNVLTRYRTIERHAEKAVAADLRALVSLCQRSSAATRDSSRRSFRNRRASPA